MSVTHQFKYTAPEGKPFISFDMWVAYLPGPEQTEFHAARKRQEAYRQQAIDCGDLVRDFSAIDPKDPSSQPTYVWKDEETARRGKAQDDTWKSYWNRYLAETGIKFEIVEITT
jgi:hypothetical protein